MDGTQDSSHQENYEEELAWCIHKLKVSLTAKNVTSKQGISTEKLLEFVTCTFFIVNVFFFLTHQWMIFERQLLHWKILMYL